MLLVNAVSFYTVAPSCRVPCFEGWVAARTIVQTIDAIVCALKLVSPNTLGINPLSAVDNLVIMRMQAVQRTHCCVGFGWRNF